MVGQRERGRNLSSCSAELATAVSFKKTRLKSYVLDIARQSDLHQNSQLVKGRLPRDLLGGLLGGTRAEPEQTQQQNANYANVRTGGNLGTLV